MQKVLEIIEEVKKAVVGKNAVVGKMLMVILAQGHILLEDIPGVGKNHPGPGLFQGDGVGLSPDAVHPGRHAHRCDRFFRIQ